MISMSRLSQPEWATSLFSSEPQVTSGSSSAPETRAKRKRQSDKLNAANRLSLDSKLGDLKLDSESIPWDTKYSPSTAENVAIHPKKVVEVKMWLRSVLEDNDDEGKKKIAVLSGPSGCGKSTLIRLLAKESNLKIFEFDVTEENKMEEENNRVFNVTQVQQFKSFLMNPDRYSEENKFVKDEASGSLILIEELPVGFYRHPAKYHEILQKYISSSCKVPIVFILSFNSSQETPPLFKLFPVDTVQQLNIEVITFRPIALTYLKKAIENVNYFHVLSQEEQRHYLDSCSGDIRSLLNALELKFKYGQKPLDVISKPKSKKARLVQNCSSHIFDSNNRDSAMDVFHFMGKILHVKRRFSEKIQFDHDFRVYPLHENVTSLLDERVITSNRINLTIHQNYCKNVQSVIGASAISDTLSLSDLFSDFRSDGRFDMTEYSSQLTVRSAMYNLSPSMVDEKGGKIDPKKKKNGMNGTVPVIPTFHSSKRELILQDRLQFYDKIKCKRDIESSCRDLIYLQTPVHQTAELFLDILPFVTEISSTNPHCDHQVRLLEQFYCRIDELVNYPESETRITDYGRQDSEGFQWIPSSAKKRLKSLCLSDLDVNINKKKLEIEQEYEEGDKIENC